MVRMSPYFITFTRPRILSCAYLVLANDIIFHSTNTANTVKNMYFGAEKSFFAIFAISQENIITATEISTKVVEKVTAAIKTKKDKIVIFSNKLIGIFHRRKNRKHRHK